LVVSSRIHSASARLSGENAISTQLFTGLRLESGIDAFSFPPAGSSSLIESVQRGLEQPATARV
jgi:hypothetical protein